MRVRVIRNLPARLEGFDLSSYRHPGTYDIGRSLAEVLFAYGHAVPDDDRALAVTVPERASVTESKAPARKAKVRKGH
jgi:hypothetical protein